MLYHWFVVSICLAAKVATSDLEKKLVEHLLDRYDPVVRPVEVDRDCINVTLNIRFYQLIAIKEKEQVMEVSIESPCTGESWVVVSHRRTRAEVDLRICSEHGALGRYLERWSGDLNCLERGPPT